MSMDFNKKKIEEGLLNALNDNKPEAFAKTLAETFSKIEEGYSTAFKEFQSSHDESIKTKYGVKTLSASEKNFWNAVKNAMVNKDVKSAFTGVEKTLPIAYIDRLLENIQEKFPVLAEIDLVNTAAITKILINKTGVQYATWGELGSKIETILEGSFDDLDLMLCKLMCFVPVSVDMLDADAEWLAAYAVKIGTAGIGAGLVKAVTDGTGKKQPIGMTRDLDGVVTAGVYPKKEATPITYFDTATLAPIIAELVVDPNGMERDDGTDDEFICITNKKTYYKKIIPAIRKYNLDGSFSDAVPFPIKFLFAPNLADDEAILGIGKAYTLGVGKGGEKGNTSYSDEVGFLDDLRYYKFKLYGNGQPNDNNAFKLLDVSGLQPSPFFVTVQGGESEATSGTDSQSEGTETNTETPAPETNTETPG